MSSVTVQWFGLDELREQLRQLPDDLTDEAGHIVEGAANAAATAARTGYAQHRFSGNLQDHVVVVPGTHDRYGAGFLVKSTAKHATIFENGTEGIRYYTGTDKRGRKFDHATRGKMPAGNVFVPAMIRARNRMYRDLADMLRRLTGWEVTGSAAA